MSNEVDAAWVTGWFTVGAAALAFLPLAFQIWSQGRQNRASNLQALRQSFNERLYVEGVAAARALSNASASFISKLYGAQQQIHLAMLIHQGIGEIRPPTMRYPEILDVEHAFGEALSDLVFLIEERRIADQRLEIFKLAFLAKSHDERQAFDSELQRGLMENLPTDKPDGGLYPYMPANEQALAKLKEGIAKLSDPLSDCIAFCEDLIVELQNAHLGDVFAAKVKHRVPPDPANVVLELAKFDDLMKWIQTTPWSKSLQGDGGEG